jgi:integrase/recombinase XerD
MGKIRDQMLAEMELRGMAVRTQDTYLMCCRKFVQHFMKSPEQLGEADTKAFILHLIRERQASPSSVGVHVAAIRFLYRVVLRRAEVVEDLPSPKVPMHLPVVPSREEVKRLLKAVRSLKYRTILTLAYGAGLRVSEACRLQVQDIDSEQMVLHIRGAKGGKERLVPLSPRMLSALRRYWAKARPPRSCLFPGRRPETPLTKDAVRKVLKCAVKDAGVTQSLSPHSLRHGFATHLLEDGEDIRVLQSILGHSHVQTTAHYARVTTRRLGKVKSPLDRLNKSTSTPGR